MKLDEFLANRVTRILAGEADQLDTLHYDCDATENAASTLEGLLSNFAAFRNLDPIASDGWRSVVDPFTVQLVKSHCVATVCRSSASASLRDAAGCC